MRFDNSFFVAASPEQAWALLLDVPKIAPCLPGARLMEILASDRYKGEALVKLGPVQLQFGGEAQLTLVNATGRTARIVAKGADRKGRGSAAAVVNFTLLPEGGGTRVNLDTDLSLAGSVAQYGRASSLVKEIANELIGQFAANLGKLIGESSTAAASVPAGSARIAASAQPSAVSASRSPLQAEAPVAVPAFRILLAAIARMIGRWLTRMVRRAS